MNKLILFLSLILIVSCTSTGTFKGHGVETEYKRFEDETLISSNSSRVHTSSASMHQVLVAAHATCSGEQICEPDRLRMHFRSTSEGWQFLRFYPITFLIDGETTRFEESDINAIRDTISGGTVSEFLYFTVNPELFRKIAFSEKVECKIGNTEFEMTFQRRESLRLLYQELYEG